MSNNIINTSSHDHQMMEAIAIGVEAKEFLNSNLAKYISNSAELRVVKAKDQLAVVNPADTEKIEELQRIIKIYDHFEQSLRELVVAGDSAYQLYLQNLELEAEQ